VARSSTRYRTKVVASGLVEELRALATVSDALADGRRFARSTWWTLSPARFMTWMGHKRIDETMLYVHVADQHRRAIPEDVLLSAAQEIDPDQRILTLLGSRATTAWQLRGSQNQKPAETLKISAG
jgi:hypothetical protein